MRHGGSLEPSSDFLDLRVSHCGKDDSDSSCDTIDKSDIPNDTGGALGD